MSGHAVFNIVEFLSHVLLITYFTLTVQVISLKSCPARLHTGALPEGSQALDNRITVRYRSHGVKSVYSAAKGEN